MWSKLTYKMKKLWGASDVGRFCVTGPTDVATKLSHFYCHLCRKDVSVLTHSHHEILQHFQGGKHFTHDQNLRLETAGWEVLDFEGNAMRPEQVKRQRESIMRAPLVVRDKDYPFSETVIVEDTGAVDTNLGILAKISYLIEVLRLGGSYELVYQLWAQLALSAVRLNLDVTWSSDEVLVSISTCCVSSTYHECIRLVACLVHHSQWDVSSDFVSSHQLDEIIRELQHGL